MIRKILRLLLPSLAMATGLATAEVTCTAEMTDVVFAVNPLSSQADATATLTYTCANTANQTRGAAVCFSIGDGAQGGGASNPRRMLNGTQPLWFQLYQDPARTLVWGSSYFGVNTPYMARIAIPRRDSVSGSQTLYGRVQGGQTGAVPGLYTDDFGGGHTAISVNESNNSNPPSSCTMDQEGDKFVFIARATVASQCAISTGTLDFGSRGLLTSNLDSTTAVSVQCASGVPWQVGLGNGLNFGSGARRMRNATRYVSYELYRNSGRTQRWGSALNVDTATGSGNGNVQNLSVYGRVPVQATPNAGTYTDVVVVTVTY
jgi:spore coat protein U-like protein